MTKKWKRMYNRKILIKLTLTNFTSYFYLSGVYTRIHYYIVALLTRIDFREDVENTKNENNKKINSKYFLLFYRHFLSM